MIIRLFALVITIAFVALVGYVTGETLIDFIPEALVTTTIGFGLWSVVFTLRTLINYLFWLD